MNIRFYNCKILTMRKEQPIFQGEVWVSQDKIIYVGPENPEYSKGMEAAGMEGAEGIIWDRMIDCKGNLLMPGFKNAHTHSAMTFLRSYADDLPLLDWLHKQVFPMEAKLNEERVYWFSKLAFMEYLTSGITADFDMYMEVEGTARASVETGFRTVFCESINDFGGTIEQVEADYLKYNRYDPLIQYRLGFHAEYTTSKTLLEQLAALAHQYQEPIFTHSSESADEVQGCIERYGMTPTEFLNQLGMFDFGGGCYHCVHMTERDLDILKEKQVSVITNPSSNAKLASGIAPITKMLEKGINVGIGTDGAASNNSLDMFREMFLATGLQKLQNHDASALAADQVLEMATVGGARAMGLTDCDVLAVGKQADMIMIDLHQPNMQPVHNIVKNIVYAGSKSNIKMTMIAGKILYEDGQFHIGVEPEVVYQKANELVGQMIRNG